MIFLYFLKIIFNISTYKLYLILVKQKFKFFKLRSLTFPKKLININVNDVVDKFFKPFAFCIIKVFKKKKI
jgi:hypothetical protein